MRKSEVLISISMSSSTTGRNIDRGKARVATCPRIKRTDTHETMHADFCLEQAIGVVAADFKRHVLHACFVAVELIKNCTVKAFHLRKAQIHAQQHPYPIARFRAACSCIDGNERSTVVELTAQQTLDLQVVQGTGKVLQQLLGFGAKLIALVGQLTRGG